MFTFCLNPEPALPAQLQGHPDGTELALPSTLPGNRDRTQRITMWGATVNRKRAPIPTRLYAGMYSSGCWHRLGKGSGGSSGAPRSGSRGRLGAPCPTPSIAASAALYATASAGLPSNGLCCAAPAGSCARRRLTVRRAQGRAGRLSGAPVSSCLSRRAAGLGQPVRRHGAAPRAVCVWRHSSARARAARAPRAPGRLQAGAASSGPLPLPGRRPQARPLPARAAAAAAAAAARWAPAP
jgi:hypothetical protein